MKNSNRVPIYLGMAVAIGILMGSFLDFENKSGSVFSDSPEESKIKRLINFIKYDYVDEVNTDILLDGAINNIIGKLDPHSVYFTQEQLQLETEELQGNFVGIGVQFRIYQDSVMVIQVLEGGPSEKVGLLAGDRILTSNQDTLSGVNLRNNDVMRILKGEPDTGIDLGIYRRTTDSVMNFSITRGDVPIKSVTSHYMINEEVGYIKLERFAMTSYDEFKVALDDLIEKGMTTLTLDLRDNGGGFMNIANQIADEFLKDDALIVFTKNKRGDVNKDFASSTGNFEDGKVYILINENSASASEIIAGALQDNDRGTIIGRRSFGKGLVQQTMGLGDGSAIRLTVARYYTPTGRSIQKPYNLSKSKEYYANFDKRYLSGELVSKDSIKVNDSLKYTTPKGKVVYGGGGIVPDKFVGIDTAQYIPSRYLLKLRNFSFDYVDNHRIIYNSIDLKGFIDNFDGDEKILNKFLETMDVVIPVSHDFRNTIRKYLKLTFAQSIFDDNEYRQVIEKSDLMIETIKELELSNKKLFLN
tara:strand:- start:1156 stop:2742 length:1587 start_codon:yes stop_codon:yes gene_type:complete